MGHSPLVCMRAHGCRYGTSLGTRLSQCTGVPDAAHLLQLHAQALQQAGESMLSALSYIPKEDSTIKQAQQRLKEQVGCSHASGQPLAS